MKKLSIVIPCYNEAENVPKLLEAYDTTISRNDIEVVLVNNGSTDATGAVLDALEGKFQRFLKIVSVPVNQGYGYGILSGLRAAEGEFIGWSHGDLQTPPVDVLKALEIIESKNSHQKLYVKGVRQGRPLSDRFFSWGMGIFETVYLKVPLSEINAQPNVFHRSFFAKWNNPPHDFALDLYTLYQAHQHKLEIVRFPVPFLKRQHGNSKWNTGIKSKWKFIKRTIHFSTTLKATLRNK